MEQITKLMSKRSLLFLFIILYSLQIFSQSVSPSVEVRAVWLATNWNLDWPSPGKTAEQQKQELRDILDKLEEANFNTVFFQARIRGDVFYKSSIEPLSPFINNKYGLSYDPLEFVVEECHIRGLECHAWLVTFPLGSEKQVRAQRKNSIVYKRKDICKLHRGEWYLDPGNPDARKYILSLVDEVVSKYDIDGIQFDYIRYPESDKSFPDNDTYKRYGRKKNLYDWRRDNINTLVSDIYDLVKSRKNWVQVSSSPLGRYRPLPVKPNDGWTAYEDVFQDAGHWLKEGKHDAVYPMMYYKNELFYPFVEDWLKNCNDRIVVPGLGAYMMSPKERNWSTQDILDQIDFIRENNVKGQAFYRTANVLDNTKGILTELESNYYNHPAKLPPMTWLDNTPPSSPVDLEVFKTRNGLTCIRWQPANKDEDLTYTVYTSFTDDIDVNDARCIISTGLRQNQIYLDVSDIDIGIYYSVTASDRYHNESTPCESGFFVHSKLEK